MKQPLNEYEELNEKHLDKDFEQERDEIAGIIQEASKSRFWNEVLIPELDNILATLDGNMTTESDPWRRYAFVEVYRAMKNFKLGLLTALD